MALLELISDVNTFTELKQIISELDNSEIIESLEALNLGISGSRRERCSRLRRGVKLLKGWTSRDSDRTTVTSASTDLTDDDLKNFAASLNPNKQDESSNTAVTV